MELVSQLTSKVAFRLNYTRSRDTVDDDISSGLVMRDIVMETQVGGCHPLGQRKGKESIGHAINVVGGSQSVTVSSLLALSAERATVPALTKMAVAGEAWRLDIENTVHGLLAKSRNNDHFLAKDPATLWRKSRLAKEMPVLLDHDSQESSTLTVADEPEWDTLEISSTPDVTTGGIGPSTTGPNELISQQPTTSNCRSLPAILDLAYPVDTLNILDNYFKYTHCWFPILEHHDMLRTMHTSAQLRKVHREGSSLVLWALVAYETLQSDTNDTAYPDHLHIQTEILSQNNKKKETSVKTAWKNGAFGQTLWNAHRVEIKICPRDLYEP
ncbi:uncharacterized protein N7506_010574 [Penicillium brevicompactum]|uniref:uncharacterized protein n=1 Tax=Penicillium brevicompactum TaxID=5074 RepID=UPI00253FDBD9|nr:uncharacterized protein N7506_010574 [Penicillium brevicompactum]KAJ5327472.1 hypothetical protein N7506_010574 [Penicillium brevicompactum]